MKFQQADDFRIQAVLVLQQVLDKGQSLSQALPKAQQHLSTPQQKSRLQEVCYGTLRYLRQVQFYANELIEKPLKPKQRLVELLVYTSIYQLAFMRMKTHAVVSESVNAVTELQQPQLKGLVNGVLRGFLRKQDDFHEKLNGLPQIKASYPNWLYKSLEQSYPDKFLEIMDNSNQYPPMWLRVNQQKASTEDYLSLLKDADLNATIHTQAKQAVLLEKPAAVDKLPDFEAGHASVQDAAAQLSVEYLQPQPDERILDCCCAPGGKTCHILETQPKLKELVALDIEASRMQRVEENLTRLNLDARLITADAIDLDSWWDGQTFDRILLDAPCSATGVIRRHPDIKWLRKKTDIQPLVDIQKHILEAMWTILKPGGTLVYATCSILPEENHQQIDSFLQQHPEASCQLFSDSGQTGRQILPGEDAMDGFYYAVLVKSKSQG